MPAQHPSIPLDGPLAPPRRNGELVFNTPWESRVFGLTAVLQEQGRWTWEEFAARFTPPACGDDVEAYYEAWVASLEALLIEQGVLAEEEIEARADQFAQGLFDYHD